MVSGISFRVFCLLLPFSPPTCSVFLCVFLRMHSCVCSYMRVVTRVLSTRVPERILKAILNGVATCVLGVF